MRKKILLLSLALVFMASPSIAAPPGGHGHGPSVRAANYHGGGMHRPPMGRPPMHGAIHHHHHMARPLPPPMYRPYRPIYRPYYSYYPTTYYSTTYSYYPSYPTYSYSYDVVEPVPASVNTVVVRDNYAGINTAANVINAAANVAATIRYLTW